MELREEGARAWTGFSDHEAAASRTSVGEAASDEEDGGAGVDSVVPCSMSKGTIALDAVAKRDIASGGSSPSLLDTRKSGLI